MPQIFAALYRQPFLLLGLATVGAGLEAEESVAQELDDLKKRVAGEKEKAEAK